MLAWLSVGKINTTEDEEGFRKVAKDTVKVTKDTVTRMTSAAMEAATAARVPVMLVGPPGTGKTESVRDLAKRIGYELITVIGSQLDPTDITGLPKGEKVLEKEDGTAVWGTTYLAPWWQVRIMQKRKVILFLDEFSNTSGATRASLLTLLQNREFPNGEVMPEETIVIGAMNPAEQAADGYELDLPTTNRLFFIPWSPSAASWYEGMLTGWGNPVSDEEMKWRQKIVGFVKDNPTWLHREPQDVETTDAYGINPNDSSQMEVFRSAWASRRSWDKLSQVLPHTPDDVSIQDMVIQGLVGYAAAGQFRDWLRRHSVIDPDAVLENPEKFNWKKMSLDDSNLVLRALLEKITDETSMQVIHVFRVIAENERQDLGAPFIRDLITRLTSSPLSKATIAENKKAALELVKVYKSVTKQ